jgi:hypothetical protein
MRSNRVWKESSQKGGSLVRSYQPKAGAVMVKAYLTSRQWLLSVPNADAERLGLEPFQKYMVKFVEFKETLKK